jgi:hypothetical protein
MGSEARQRWFAAILEAGLEERLLGPAELLTHVTPELLAAHLPGEILGEILAVSLESHTLTPASLLETVTPDLLAEHIPHEVLWACIAEAVERAGIPKSAQSA